MKRMSLPSLVCVAVLSAACNGKGTNEGHGTATDGSSARPGSAASGPVDTSSGRLLADDNTPAVGTSGVADQGGASGVTGTPGSQSPSPAGSDRQQFTQQAAVAGMAEVQLGRLAEQRASDAGVKDFARMMVRDHSKANDELKRVAKSQNIPLPTDLDQKHRDLMVRLQALRGADFDREYMQAMVDGHMEARDLLSRGAGSQVASPGSSAVAGGNQSSTSGTGGPASSTSGTSGRAQSATAGVEQWASKTLPTVEHHLQQAQQINMRVQTNATGSSSGSSGAAGASSPPTGAGTGAGSGTRGTGNSGSGTPSSGR